MKGVYWKVGIEESTLTSEEKDTFTFKKREEAHIPPLFPALTFSLSILNMSFLRRPAFDREPHPVLLPEETFNLCLPGSLCLYFWLSHTFVRCYLWVLYSRVAACLQHLLVLENQSQSSCQREEWEKERQEQRGKNTWDSGRGRRARRFMRKMVGRAHVALVDVVRALASELTRHSANDGRYDGSSRTKQTNKWWASAN